LTQYNIIIMNTDWDLLMNSIKTFQRTKYTLEYYGGPSRPPVLCRPSRHHIRDGHSQIIYSFMKTHKEKKEYLKMNKIKGYSKCTNHQQLNKLLMSF